MEKEIKRYLEIYDRKIMKEYTIDGSTVNFKSFKMKFIKLLNEDEFINDLENLFITSVPSNVYENKFHYLFHFIYEKEKIRICTSTFSYYAITILRDGKWISLDKAGIDGKEFKKFEFEEIVNKLIYNLLNNSTERIKFLLNK